MIKVAVIGVGSIGQHHVRNYHQSSLATLVGISDANPGTAKRIGERHKVPFYEDYRQLLEKEKPEAVSIAVPTEAHFEVVKGALQAGCHVLVEKPIAATVEQGKAMVKMALDEKCVLRVGHIERFNPAIIKLKEILQTGILGNIFQIHARRLGPFPPHIRDVGVVLDLAVHDLDIMRYLTDSEVTRLYSETSQVQHAKHEDIFSGTIRFANNVLGVLQLNWHTPKKTREISVIGENGMLEVDYVEQALRFYRKNAAQNDIIGMITENYIIIKQEPLRAELDNFIEDVQQNKYQPNQKYQGASGNDGVAALKLAQALVHSGLEQEIIYFSIDS